MASLGSTASQACWSRVDVAACDRLASTSAILGEDMFISRAFSGRLATSCSSPEGRHGERGCGSSARVEQPTFGRSSFFGLSSMTSKSVLLGHGRGLHSDSLGHACLCVMSRSLGRNGMRYVGRKSTLKARGLSGDHSEARTFDKHRGRKEVKQQSASRVPSAGVESNLVASGSADGQQSIQTSITKAFSSMVLMLKTLQSYALQMRSMLFYEDVESVAHVIHREMQASLLWLFQQVFACTPMLMISVMVLFSDFTAHSASANITLSEQHSGPSPIPASISLRLAEVGSAAASFTGPLEVDEVQVYPEVAGGLGGRGGRATSLTTLRGDGYGEESAWRSGVSSSHGGATVKQQDGEVQGLPEGGKKAYTELSRLFDSTLEEMTLREGQPIAFLKLDQEVVRQLVAPVSIELEKDDYICFDRTDLQYQHAIREDPNNTMLLSNYAQFLYIVRRDYERSEEYFHQALKEDPTDGDILGRFATFLWLGRKDRDAAERAYKAALAASPDNPYFSGSYAHFLWHSGDDESACPVM